MPSLKQPSNPFYLGLLVVGTTFAITACAYGVLIVLKQDPRRSLQSPLVEFLDQRGLTLLLIELGILAILTFAAIGTEDYWESRATGNKDRE
jgi:hypothetical protein